MTENNFIVLDTEGRNVINEIAIIDHQGELIYEAFNEEAFSIYEQRFNRKSLVNIVEDLCKLASEKTIICHSAEHDSKVLRRSFKQVKLPWQNFPFSCTYELAKANFPNLSSYSLEYLSKHFRLKVQGKYFNPKLAHTARYDTEFTYHLYKKIIQDISTLESNDSPMSIEKLKNKPNPFRSSRVDTPFQQHEDLKKISQPEFETLKQILVDIKHDQNHQSMGAVVIGEAGSGKTHLMMRLAQEFLSNNRLLFIRQPNNPDAVMYHIYSRILESLIIKVPGSGYTQLEHLLAKSFTKLIREYKFSTTNHTDAIIRKITDNNALNIYKILQKLGTGKNRQHWDNIEKRVIEWWTNEYGIAGYNLQILKGITRFCRYSEKNRKHLVRRWLSVEELDQEDLNKIGLENWDEEMGKEEFALQAMTVLSKLSRLDEPLIIVFDQLEALGYDHNRQILLKFGEAVKEIFTHVNNSLIILNLFPDRWQQFQGIFDSAVVGRVAQCPITLRQPTKDKLTDILNWKLIGNGNDVTVEELFNAAQLQDILQQKSIRLSLNRAYKYYSNLLNSTDDNCLPSLPPSTEDPHNLNSRLEKLEDEFSSLRKIVNNLRQELLSEFQSDYLENTDNNSLPEELNHGKNRPEKLEEQFSSLPKVVNDLRKELLQEKDELDKKISNIAKQKKLEVSTESLDENKGNLANQKPQIHAKEIKHDNTKQENSNYHNKTELRKYFEELHQKKQEEYSDLQIFNDEDDIGKVIQIAEAFKKFLNPKLQLESLRLGKQKIPEHTLIKTLKHNSVVSFLSAGGNSFTNRIENFNQLVLRHQDTNFYLRRDIRQPEITGKKGKREKDKLNNTTNGEFIVMGKEDRVDLELIDQALKDYYNKDLPFEVKIEELLSQLTNYLPNYWLIKLLVN